jgi:hypothetical protein
MADEQSGTKTGDKGSVKPTAGKGSTEVSSPVPERVEGQFNPSSPGDTGTTPGSNAKIG